MRPSTVPVTMGSPRFRAVDTLGCSVTEAWFSAGDVLHPHTHDRTVLAVMLHGSFETRIAGHSLDCVPGSAWTEPREERHANHIGNAGAHVLVVQPDPKRLDLFAAFDGLLHRVNYVRDARIALDARRVLLELGSADAVTPIAIDALVLDMMTTAIRRSGKTRRGKPPVWLLRVQEMLHESFFAPLSIGQIASACNVSPSHVCHAFRRYFGTTVGDYLRTRRVNWATERLVTSDASISSIAAAAGYADQSHLTRECRRYLGVGPAEYRRTHRLASRTA